MDSLVRLFGGHIYTSPRGGQLKAAIVRVMQAVASHLDWTDAARQDAGCRPGQARVASMCCLDVRTVRRQMKAAVDLNLIRYVEAGAGQPNHTFFNPGLLAAARQMDSLPWKQQRTFTVDLSELPPWGLDDDGAADADPLLSSEPSVIANAKQAKKPYARLDESPCATKFIADKNAIKVIADKMSGKSFRDAQPPALSHLSGPLSRVADGEVSLLSAPWGGGAVRAPLGSTLQGELCSLSQTQLLDRDRFGDHGLGQFWDFLDTSGIDGLWFAMQRRKVDGSRGGTFGRGLATSLAEMERAVLWAADQYSVGPGRTSRIEVLCHSPRLLLVDDVRISSVEAYCKKTSFRAAVTETSPNNCQALFVAPIGFTDTQNRNARRALMLAFLAERDLKRDVKGADPNSVGLGQLHRLPGSLNCKNGPDGQRSLFIARLIAVFDGNEISSDLTSEYVENQYQDETLAVANSGQVVDDSRHDFHIACEMVRQGRPPAAIEAAMFQSARRSDRRKVRSEAVAQAYAVSTTREALRRAFG